VSTAVRDRELAAAQLMEHRPMLFGLAYRLLGSAHDAEDVLQDAYLRWSRVDRDKVAEPRRYLTRVVTTVAIDRLRQRQARRESYVGPWLPEPVPTVDLAERAEQHESLSVALLHLMERLTPTQRAVYVLRTAFEMPYADIAEVVGQPEATCRQLHRRAVAALDDAGRRRFTADRRRHRELLGAFLGAAENGAIEELQRLLHEDVTAWSDGGGRVRAARRPVGGRWKVARFFAGLYGRPELPVTIESADLNGAPAAVVTLREQRHALLLGVTGERIEGLYVIANPDKLVLLDGAGTRLRPS
jgi:RNA polymerase sigma-70 factor (ECF subfamily)